MTESGTVSIWIPGIPKTKGSLTPILLNADAVIRGGLIPGTRRPRVRPKTAMVESGTADIRRARKQWQKAIKDYAMIEWNRPPIGAQIPVFLGLEFVLPRPVSVKRPWPSSRSAGDLDKHERTVLDALTGIIYVDDSQVVKMDPCPLKRYAKDGESPGLHLTIRLA